MYPTWNLDDFTVPQISEKLMSPQLKEIVDSINDGHAAVKLAEKSIRHCLETMVFSQAILTIIAKENKSLLEITPELASIDDLIIRYFELYFDETCPLWRADFFKGQLETKLAQASSKLGRKKYAQRLVLYTHNLLNTNHLIQILSITHDDIKENNSAYKKMTESFQLYTDLFLQVGEE